MPHTLFSSVSNLYQQLEVENLDIHSTQKELENIVLLGRQNDKLRIITQFVSTLEALARNYEYDDAQSIAKIKVILKEGLLLIIHMVETKVSNLDGAYKMERLIQESRSLLKNKASNDPFILDENLLLQLAHDLQKDCTAIRSLFVAPILVNNTKQYYETLSYYLQKMQERVTFIGVQSLSDFISSAVELVSNEYQNHHFSELGSHADFLLFLEKLEDISKFINDNFNQKQMIVDYFSQNSNESLQKRLKTSPYQIKQPEESQQGVILTDDEISALMSDDYSVEMISFDSEPTNLQMKLPEPEAHSQQIRIQEEEYQNLMRESLKIKPLEISQDTLFEEELIRYMGRLFQKQEVLLDTLSEEQKVEMSEDIVEMNTLTSNIKNSLFENYHVSVEKLIGKELRQFIQKEVKDLGKKIRLGIRGERSEMLMKDSNFIKDLVFTLVRNSLHYSLEPVFRRRATDKPETSWLLIEFEDAGNTFDIYIRDDGRGLVPDQMNIEEIQDNIINKGGALDIDSLDGEYLKVHVQLPMQKILVKSLATRVGAVNVLIPDRCIQKVVSQKEAQMYQKEESCLGQVNLSTLLGVDHSVSNMFVICEFGMNTILLGVENILYNIEAVIENIDFPLVAGIGYVTILKDGSVGFVLDERAVYQKAKDLILKRDK